MGAEGGEGEGRRKRRIPNDPRDHQTTGRRVRYEMRAAKVCDRFESGPRPANASETVWKPLRALHTARPIVSPVASKRRRDVGGPSRIPLCGAGRFFVFKNNESVIDTIRVRSDGRHCNLYTVGVGGRRRRMFITDFTPPTGIRH